MLAIFVKVFFPNFFSLSGVGLYDFKLDISSKLDVAKQIVSRILRSADLLQIPNNSLQVVMIVICLFVCLTLMVFKANAKNIE